MTNLDATLALAPADLDAVFGGWLGEHDTEAAQPFQGWTGEGDSWDPDAGLQTEPSFGSPWSPQETEWGADGAEQMNGADPWIGEYDSYDPESTFQNPEGEIGAGDIDFGGMEM